jgi:hypothetical protein
MDILNPPRLIRARLSDNYNVKKPETFFAIFIGDKQFNILAQHINTYIQYQLANFPARHKSRKS